MEFRAATIAGLNSFDTEHRIDVGNLLASPGLHGVCSATLPPGGNGEAEKI